MPPELTLESLQQVVDKLCADIHAEFDKKDKASADRIEALTKQYADLSDDVVRLRNERKSSAPGHIGYKPTGDPVKDFSFARAIYGHATGWRNGDTPERAMIEAATKALSAGVDSEGGFAVPSELMPEMVELLRAKSVTMELGVRVLDGLVGSPIQFTKQTGAGTAFWTDENDTITQSQQVFGQVTANPHGLRALTSISNRLLAQASANIEQMVREDLAKVLALKLDLAVMKGAGGAGEPLGIVNVAGIGSVSFAALAGGAAQTLTTLLDSMMGSLDDNNAMEGKLGWAMHPQAKRKLAGLYDSTGRPLLSGALQGLFNYTADGRQMYGHPYRTSTQLTGGATADLIFANWSDILLCQWGTLRIDASDVAGDAFEKNQTKVRAMLDADVVLRHEKSVAVATAFNAT